MLDKVTQTNLEDIFTVRKYDKVPYERPYTGYWASATFEMDFDMWYIERNKYTVFDLLSDVGGLLGILTAISSIMISIWNYQNFDNFMVSRLFKIELP